GAGAVGKGVGRIEPDGLTVVGDGAIVITLPTIGDAAVVEEERIERSEPNGGGVISDGAVVIALDAIRGAAAIVGGWIVRLQPQRCIVIGDGAVVVALLDVGGPPVLQRFDLHPQRQPPALLQQQRTGSNGTIGVGPGAILVGLRRCHAARGTG